MVKTFIALRHMIDKEFGVEFLHEKVSSDPGSGINFIFRISDCEKYKVGERAHL